ncbi:MAG: cation:proton antiporter regulatory subunit [Anaerotignaceae bacterium]
MSVISSFLLFGVFVIIYTVMIEIFTILFQLTGVTRDKARTQVISLVTNSGFTTTESEVIMASKKRRDLARIAMLIGNAFAVIIVSVLVNIFLKLGQSEAKNLMHSIIIIIVVLVGYALLVRVQFVRRKFDDFIEKLGNRALFGEGSNVLMLMDMVKNKAIVEVKLEHLPICLKETKLADSMIRSHYKIQILLVQRNDEPLDQIDGETVIEEGDCLLVFGEYKIIKEVFEKPNK